MKKALIGCALAGLAFIATAAQADVILAPGSDWEYTFSNPTGDPTWNTTTGGWNVGPAPFGNQFGGDFGYSSGTYWPADSWGDMDNDLWVRTSIDLTGYDLSSIAWNLGSDNGFTLFLNGILISSLNAEGYTYRWEYNGTFGSAAVAGINVLAVALEDHGGATAFDMQVTGTPVPEPSTLGLLGLGLMALALRRRTR